MAASERRFERTVRRVGAESAAPSVTMKRSMTEERKSTSAERAKPTDAPKEPSFPAANSNALARAGLDGDAAQRALAGKAGHVWTQ